MCCPIPISRYVWKVVNGQLKLRTFLALLQPEPVSTLKHHVLGTGYAALGGIATLSIVFPCAPVVIVTLSDGADTGVGAVLGAERWLGKVLNTCLD